MSLRRAALLLPALTLALTLHLHAQLSSVLSSAPPPPPKQLTIPDIFKSPSLTGTPPRGFQWSPDGRTLSFIAPPDTSTGQPGDLLAFDTVSALTRVLVPHDKLADSKLNERDRDHRSRYQMPSYTWAPDGHHLLLDDAGTLALYDIASGAVDVIARTGAGSGDDPQFSPDGRTLSYIAHHDLCITPVNKPRERCLTNSPSPAILNGEVDWVSLEELEVRTNTFWSPDSQHLAYLQSDESRVPQYALTTLDTDHGAPHVVPDPQRYPQPGDPNPAVRVGVVSAGGGKTTWLDLPFISGDDYIPRFGWVDAHTLYVEVLARDQRSLSLYLADAPSGHSRLVYSDADPQYLDTSFDIFFLDPSRFVTLSWRDGHTHLYLYTLNADRTSAALTRQLTHGNFEVKRVYSADANSVLFSANLDSPITSDLYSVALDGSAPRRLTPAGGSHYVDPAPNSAHFLDYSSNSITPHSAQVCDAHSVCTALWHPHTLVELGYAPVTPLLITLHAADHATTLYASLLLPPSATGKASVPLILNPYGGPHEQAVTDGWRGPDSLFDQLLVQHGFAVLHVDNRGMGGRGRNFEQSAAFLHAGDIQLADQLAALDQVLAAYPQLNPNKIGFWGWSWGGTFTVYALEHSTRFAAGVAVAPVTDFRLYDSVYTERYFGLPSANAAAYDATNLSASAAQLHGHLLLAYGTGDDNVHPVNSELLQNALVAAHIPFTVQTYPGKTHAISGADARTDLFSRILQHFEDNLK